MLKTLRSLPLVLTFLGALLLPSLATAQGPTSPLAPRRMKPPSWPDLSVLAGAGTNGGGGVCQAGIVYDDGTVEGGLAFTATQLDMVQRFDLGTAGARIEQVCVCWTRDSNQGPQVNLPFELVFYDIATGGEPGDLITAVPVTAPSVPEFMDSAFYTFDLVDLDIVAPDDQVFIGVSWLANANPEFFLCTDDNGDAHQPIFASGDLGSSWSAIREIPPGPDEPPDSLSRIDALMIRADTFETEPFDCVEDDETLCLTNDQTTVGRFQVKVDWRTNQGTQGVGMAKELTQDTGYFWFFNEENVELVIKVLNACSFADRFWVFAGGLTNVEVHITVTDSFTGRSKVYDNPLNTAFEPIQDTQAFDTCP